QTFRDHQAPLLAPKEEVMFADVPTGAIFWGQDIEASSIISFQDNPEAADKVSVEFYSVPLPNDLIQNAILECKLMVENETAPGEGTGAEAFLQLAQESNSPYPRLLAIPVVQPQPGSGTGELMRIPIGPSYYGVALLNEKRLTGPTITALRETEPLNS